MADRPKQLGDLAIVRLLDALTDAEVTVGLHEEEGGQIVEGSDATLARIAAWNEYGTTQIPASPSYRQFAASESVDRESRQLTDALKTAADSAATETALDRFGQHLAEGLWKHVDNFAAPPNADSTVRVKGRNDPLVNSGRTRDSISWVLSRRGTRIKKSRVRG
jgi:hypothetical protein